MTQYQLLGKTSPTRSVIVLAYPSIISLAATWPTSPQIPGVSLSVVFSFKNAGGSGVVTFTLKNGATILGTVNLSVAEGTVTQNGSIAFTMPSADASLSLTSNYGGSISATIQALIKVATSLTLTLPASVAPNTPVSASGKLSRDDAGTTGIGAQTINVYNTATGLTVAVASTDSAGNFDAEFTAPATAGTYSYAASYGGSGLLSASLSNVAGFILEGTVDYGILPWLILGGVALVVFASGKKSRSK
jgi:hypothetical protein